MTQTARWIGAGCVAAMLVALPWSAPFARAQQDRPDGKASADKPAADKKAEDRKTDDQKPADKKPSDKKPNKGGEVRQEKKEIRRGERSDIEARCLAFAREHHPELADLLERLAEMDEAAFRRAIADLHREVDRIDKVREKTPPRYAAEIERWKVESRIRLIAARGAMSDSPEHEAELRAAVAERIDLKTRFLTEEKAQVEARLKKLNESLSELQKDRQKLIDNEVARLRKSAGSATAARKNPPASKEGRETKKGSSPPRRSNDTRSTTSAGASAKSTEK